MKNMIYYTEYSSFEFIYDSDLKTLGRTSAKIVYRKNDSEDEYPLFIFLRNESLICKCLDSEINSGNSDAECFCQKGMFEKSDSELF